MLRFLFAAAIAAILSPASASFYNVDLFGSDFAVPGTGGITTLNVCSQSGLVCAKEQQSAVFQFQPGDTVDFGQLTLRSNAIPNISGTTYITPFVDVVFNAPLQPTPPFGNYSGGICINPAVCDLTMTFGLVYTLPDDARNIQLTFNYPIVSYVAPVPEPATWILLVAGFVLLAGYRFPLRRVRRLISQRRLIPPVTAS